MKRTKLWTVIQNEHGVSVAKPIEDIESSDTEAKLEDLLVHSPSLLSENLALVGRQIPTTGGFLDLLGVDQDGGIVVYELKRGTLTREAVAQVIDYASDLQERGVDNVAKLIEDHSGINGIDKIDDFLDWYDKEHPDDRDSLLKPPKMVLVGLGADERAVRMVNFLASAGIDIRLLTFHAFTHGDTLLLSRQVESISPIIVGTGSSGYTKEGNERILLESAASLNVKELLEKTSTYIRRKLSSYQWPGKTSYSFFLQGRTSEGKPSPHSYVTLYLNFKEKGSLLMEINPRVIKEAESTLDEFCKRVPKAVKNPSKYSSLELKITDEVWEKNIDNIEFLLDGIICGWKNVMEQYEENTDDV